MSRSEIDVKPRNSDLVRSLRGALCASICLASLFVPSAAYATATLGTVEVHGYIEPFGAYESYWDWTGWYDDNYSDDWAGVSTGWTEDPVCSSIRASAPQGCNSNNAVTPSGYDFPSIGEYNIGSGIGRVLGITGTWFGMPNNSPVAISLRNSLAMHTARITSINPQYENGGVEIQEANRDLIIGVYSACQSIIGGLGLWTGLDCIMAAEYLAHESGQTNWFISWQHQSGFSGIQILGANFDYVPQNSLDV